VGVLLLLLLLLKLEASVMFVRLTFPPAAVHHASKMHCHRVWLTGHCRVCVTRGKSRLEKRVT
jgi:hypothetical protein